MTVGSVIVVSEEEAALAGSFTQTIDKLVSS